MPRRSISLATLALAVSVPALVMFVALAPHGANRANAAFPGTSGKIAFDSYRYFSNFYAEVETMNPDGSNRQVLLFCDRGCDLPAWTADGQRVAVVTYAPYNIGPPTLLAVNEDGTGVVRLLPIGYFAYRPAWSPDNVHILYESSTYPSYKLEVWTADTVTQSPTRLTNSGANDRAPVWSPNGTEIAFFSDRDGNDEIYVMNSNGSGQTRITNQPGHDVDPDWAPDGSKLVFASDRDGNYEIYVMNANGTGQTRITNNAGKDEQPVWSPDGTKIAFTSNRDGNREIYIMNADGSSQTNITNDPYDDYEPDWQPIPLPSTPTPSATATPLPATATSTPTPKPVGGVSTDVPVGNGSVPFDWQLTLAALALIGLVVGWATRRRPAR